MARRPALLCGAIVLSCSLILAITFTCSETKQVVLPAQPPARFFSPGAPVVDLYLGQLDEAESLRSASEVSLLYFYAPWCGQSISARGEIEKVARKLADQSTAALFHAFVPVELWSAVLLHVFVPVELWSAALFHAFVPVELWSAALLHVFVPVELWSAVLLHVFVPVELWSAALLHVFVPVELWSAALLHVFVPVELWSAALLHVFVRGAVDCRALPRVRPGGAVECCAASCVCPGGAVECCAASCVCPGGAVECCAASCVCPGGAVECCAASRVCPGGAVECCAASYVQFVAVNCWWNQGKCRKQNNFYHYPVIYLYHRRFGPIEYNGPITAAYVEKFIRRVITPLQYVPSRAGLQDFLSHYEPGVLGYFEFNASPQPPGYLTFLTSALQALRRAISLDAPGTVYMHRHFNTSLTFPSHVLNFTSENICRWALEHRERLVRWLRPHGGKSRALEQELRKGAALIIFLPFDPMAPSQPLVEEVAEIAVQYHSCNGSSWPSFMEPEVWGKPGSLSRAPCCNTLAVPHWLSVSRTHNVCELCLDQALGPRPCPSLDSLYLREDSFTQPLSGKVQCSHVLSSSCPLDYYTACCWSLSKGSSTQQDRHAALPHIEDRGSASAHSAVTGLKCRTNKTLNFYLLDSGLHWEFARRLGAPENTSMMGFATVLNLQDEVHHVLNQEQGIVRNTLESFIQNYSTPYSPLQRHLVGEAAREPVGESLITAVTTQTFHKAVMDPEKDVLLFYYTQWCGFCSALNHVIIQLARLSLSNPRLAVCRKHLSVKYPEDAPITLPNLVRFIQRHSSPLRSSSREGTAAAEAVSTRQQGRHTPGRVREQRHTPAGIPL
ncbi:Thioredoxin domain-containing protein 11 [Acipenser ruthenus]|uniref:Thioredoxin domain-containing protein 11 n=1 Tax=Acipenser ruthenus TaxID=7906 RepID=A0A444TYM5_ACIRT|nr:Thioredoxin domain-containing protein 11 [Acipenser ruthenus]